MAESIFGRPPLIDDSGAILSDWKSIIDDGKYIGNNAQDTNGSSTLYTVPTGKVAYITTISQQSRTGAVGGVGSTTLTVAEKRLIFLRTPNVANQTQNMVLAFSIPIKLIAGQTIVGTSTGANVEHNSTFTGYEING